jgi:hypothetical protein
MASGTLSGRVTSRRPADVSAADGSRLGLDGPVGGASRRRTGVDPFGFSNVPVDPARPYVMNDLEIATSLVCGSDPSVSPLRRPSGDALDARVALEHALLPALQRPPCLVAFSGGLDSSGILAAATATARKHGLPLPIPATNRFPRAPDVDESSWQELVVAHLGLDEWVRVDIDDELDVIGPVATVHLRKYGVLWPPNAHFLTPLAQRADAGTLLTGIGGDELFTPGMSRGARVLAGEVAPRRADLREVAAVLAPRPLRRRHLRGSFSPPPWLRPHAQRLWQDALAREATGEPLWWGRSVLRNWWRSRARIGVVSSLAAAAGDAVVVRHPFMNPGFVRAVAVERWRTGFPSREAALERLFGDLVPPAVRKRTDKTAFFAPFVNVHSRSFIATWDGSGIDLALVDPERLRATWLEAEVDARSYLCLQAAWLASQTRAAE